MKKILILGGNYLHKKVVEAANEMGYFTIVTDNVLNSPAKLIANKSYDITVSDIDSLAIMCREEGVEAIVNVCLDFCQEYYQQLCEKMQLPCYGTREQFKILTDKKEFKKVCEKNNVDIIPSYSENDIKNNSVLVEYPVLIKPGKGNGSKGQSVCYNNSEAIRAIDLARKYSRTNHIIIEKYMCKKPDFQVTYLVINSIPYVVRTADRFLGSKEEDMDRVAIALQSPSSSTSFYFEKIHKKVCNMIRDIGIINAPFFIQGFIDGDTVRFYDPGLRFPGGEYDRIYADIMDVNLMKMLIEFAFNGKINNYQENKLEKVTSDSVFLKNNIVFTLHPTIRAGVIAAITDKERLLEIPGVYYVSMRHNVGEKIDFTGDVNQRIAEFNICGKDSKNIYNTIKGIQSIFEVLDENGENMLFNKFDIDAWYASRKRGKIK